MKKQLSFLLAISMLIVWIGSIGLANIAKAQTYQYGDINYDESIDMRDVLGFRNYLLNPDWVHTFHEQAADVNKDGDLNLQDVLLIRKFMAHMIPSLGTFESDLSGTTQPTINHENPRINFISDSKASLGVWWWHQESERTRDKYMDFLEENQVTEIYYYCAQLLDSDSGRTTIHNFVQAAMQRNMRVCVLFDEQGVVRAGSKSFINAYNLYLQYKEIYPADALYGLHCDIEPQAADRASSESWQQWFQGYATNFLGQVKQARDHGVWVELDIGCGWDFLSQKVIYDLGFTPLYEQKGRPTDNGDGTYTVRFFDAIANCCDVMCMMAYRDTAKEILSVAEYGRRAVDLTGIKIVYGVETGNDGEGDHVDFYADSKEIMYTELLKALGMLQEKPPVGEYGFAIHYMRMWYNLRDILK
ncbi:MAG: hypothetical protein J6Z00_01850 [Clostridia bacterium]|nr:hypothetical protein [Clostridia bacterium]